MQIWEIDTISPVIMDFLFLNFFVILLNEISSVFLQLADPVFLFQRENIWGPFLIISPASTLNNWHQEFTRFVPKFKVKINPI